MMLQLGMFVDEVVAVIPRLAWSDLANRPSKGIDSFDQVNESLL